jgi:CRP/FNR family transcriptional regulator
MDLRKLTSIFSFERELLDRIEQLEVIEIAPGEIILKEHEFIKVVPLVLEGSIKLRKLDPSGREIIFYHIEPGESCILSITSCLHEKESHAEAIIEKRTRLIVVEANEVRLWMNRFPSWRRFIVKLYYERMAELMILLDSVIFKSVDDRLIHYLNDKATDNEVEITHQQLASELGTAREVISRLLKQMERDEYIALERGKIKIIKPL